MNILALELTQGNVQAILAIAIALFVGHAGPKALSWLRSHNHPVIADDLEIVVGILVQSIRESDKGGHVTAAVAEKAAMAGVSDHPEIVKAQG